MTSIVGTRDRADFEDQFSRLGEQVENLKKVLSESKDPAERERLEQSITHLLEKSIQEFSDFRMIHPQAAKKLRSKVLGQQEKIRALLKDVQQSKTAHVSTVAFGVLSAAGGAASSSYVPPSLNEQYKEPIVNVSKGEEKGEKVSTFEKMSASSSAPAASSSSSEKEEKVSENFFKETEKNIEKDSPAAQKDTSLFQKEFGNEG